MKKSAVIISLVVLAAIVAVVYVIANLSSAFISNDNLNQVARAGDLTRCSELVRDGSDVNGAGMHGMKPLMSACEAGNLKVAMYLIEHGADVNSHQ